MSVQTGADVVDDVWGGTLTEIGVTNMPAGGSPANQNVEFLPGVIRTRGGLQVSQSYSGIAGGPWSVRYAKDYAVVPENQTTLALLWNGTNSVGKLVAGTSAIGQVYGYSNTQPWNPSLTDAGFGGPIAHSVTQFSRKYIAVSQGRYGWDIPRQWDGTNLRRVSQCGPGATGTVSNFLPAAANIASSGTGTGVTIAASPSGAVRGTPVSYSGSIYAPPLGWVSWSVTYDTTITFTTTTAHGASVGQQISVTGCSPSDFNGNYVVTQVISSTQLVVAQTSTNYGETGGAGTLTPLPNTVQRYNGVVTVYTSAAHNFQAGWTVAIAGVPDVAVGGGIKSISQVNGVGTCVTNSAHGLVPGTSVDITGTTNYNSPSGTPYIVVSVPTPTSFTFVYLSNVPAETTGTVSSVFNGSFAIEQTPSATSFTYQSLGPNIGETPASGTATITGNVVAGAHQVAVSFITDTGYITRPSPPVTVYAIGGQLLQIQNLPTGPSNVVGRLIMATLVLEPPANTGDFYSIRGPNISQGINFQINDNTTTAVAFDFTDTDLANGFSADYLFDLVELGPCASFASYAGRIFAIGELATVQDLENLSFNGGWNFPSPPTFGPGIATSGVDDGGSYPWTTPANVGSTSAYASASSPSPYGTTNGLNATEFGFASSGTPQGIQVKLEAYFNSTLTNPSGGVTAQLLKAGVPVGSAKSVSITSADATYILGSTTDLWGATLTAADINASTFGVVLHGAVGNSQTHGTGGTIYIRNVNIIATMVGTAAQPLGWTLDSQYGAGSGMIAGGGVFGDAYTVNATTGEGMIWQSAYADSFGDPIFSVKTKYGARVTAYASSTAVNCVVEFYSPSQGSLALVTLSNFGTTFETQIGAMNNTLPGTLPVDTLLRFYTTSASGTLTIDRIELYPVNQPINTTVVRASRLEDPESFDGVLGLIQPIYFNGQAVRAMHVIRDSLYFECDRAMYVTKDTGGEPATWTIDPVSSAIGCFGPRAVALGEDWAVKANRYGLYIYIGREPQKISHEIQTLWNQINLAYAGKVWVEVDPNERKIYVGAPVNGATEVNQIFVMSYETQDTSQDIAAYGTLRFSAYSGRRLVLDQGRKWTIWNFKDTSGNPINLPCGSFVEQSDGSALFLLGGGADSNLYFIDTTNRGNDNGAAVLSSYTTHFFPTYEEEQQLAGDDGRRLRSHMHAFNFLRHNAVGSGEMSVYLYDGTISEANGNPKLIDKFPLSASRFNGDAETVPQDWTSERWAMKFETNGVGDWFQIERSVHVVEQGPDSLVRGGTPA